nr:MAG TPA: hypothetical protein [Caudoviricetes sp.]
MKGRLFIDGNDAFTEYGVFVEQYGYKALIQEPPFKSIDSTEWDEFDGAEYDLANPVLDSKAFSIDFCITDIISASDMFELLSDKAYHTFDFRELGKTYRLRLTSNGSLSSKVRLGKLSLGFADDFPTPDKIAPYPTGAVDVRQSGYELDDIDFSRFGVYILNGTDDNVLKAPDVRPNLTINTKGEAGVSYDGEIVMYKPKDVVVKMLIRAANVTVFWKRWNALFTALIKPDTRRFYIDKTVEEFDCFYRKCSVSKFDILRNGRVWCEFSVTLTFTNSRPTGNYALLVTEDDELVLTEDGESYILLRND